MEEKRNGIPLQAATRSVTQKPGALNSHIGRRIIKDTADSTVPNAREVVPT